MLEKRDIENRGIVSTDVTAKIFREKKLLRNCTKFEMLVSPYDYTK